VRPRRDPRATAPRLHRASACLHVALSVWSREQGRSGVRRLAGRQSHCCKLFGKETGRAQRCAHRTANQCARTRRRGAFTKMSAQPGHACAVAESAPSGPSRRRAIESRVAANCGGRSATSWCVADHSSRSRARGLPSACGHRAQQFEVRPSAGTEGDGVFRGAPLGHRASSAFESSLSHGFFGRHAPALQRMVRAGLSPAIAACGLVAAALLANSMMGPRGVVGDLGRYRRRARWAGIRPGGSSLILTDRRAVLGLGFEARFRPASRPLP